MIGGARFKAVEDNCFHCYVCDLCLMRVSALRPPARYVLFHGDNGCEFSLRSFEVPTIELKDADETNHSGT